MQKRYVSVMDERLLQVVFGEAARKRCRGRSESVGGGERYFGRALLSWTEKPDEGGESFRGIEGA